jgi:hypothetical protein
MLNPYSYAEKELDLIDDKVDEMLKAGYCRLSKSPAAFPALLTLKPGDTDKRFCVNLSG